MNSNFPRKTPKNTSPHSNDSFGDQIPEHKNKNFESFFNEFFSGGASVWLKILGGAIATPIAIVVFGFKAMRKNQADMPQDLGMIAAILGGGSIVGGILGGLLTAKDVVQNRTEAGKPVPFPLKLLFGFGIWSLLFVWVPGIMVTVFFVGAILFS